MDMPRTLTGPGGNTECKQINNCMRISGTVIRYDESKGYGYIAPEKGKLVYVTAGALTESGIDGLNAGDKVTFMRERALIGTQKFKGKQALKLELASTK